MFYQLRLMHTKINARMEIIHARREIGAITQITMNMFIKHNNVVYIFEQAQIRYGRT